MTAEQTKLVVDWLKTGLRYTDADETTAIINNDTEGRNQAKKRMKAFQAAIKELGAL
ncbi:hypothetical protein [Cohaesibacter celericrescens]|uniref:hypothetical protein n=1 Tax=Cohaesibacter celericrescens TaxID=2067669 RepID=UPI003566A82C